MYLCRLHLQPASNVSQETTAARAVKMLLDAMWSLRFRESAPDIFRPPTTHMRVFRLRLQELVSAELQIALGDDDMLDGDRMAWTNQCVSSCVRFCTMVVFCTFIFSSDSI